MGPPPQGKSPWARVHTRSAVQRRTRGTAWAHRGHSVVLVLVVNSAVCDVRPTVLIAENSWHRKCLWRGPVLGRHGNDDIHKRRWFWRGESPGAASGCGETWHPHKPSKSDEGLKLLLGDMNLPMVHVVEDRQEGVVLDTCRWRVARTRWGRQGSTVNCPLLVHPHACTHA